MHHTQTNTVTVCVLDLNIVISDINTFSFLFFFVIFLFTMYKVKAEYISCIFVQRIFCMFKNAANLISLCSTGLDGL